MTSVNRIPSLTRRAIRSSVMIEGWGLYTEQLMHDVGYYDDAARLAQLAMRLLRALRIVLDMELQSGELTYEAAVARAVSVGRLEESTARSEVARYTMTRPSPSATWSAASTAWPPPQARLGDAFRLRRFHDRVLSYGHMPPTLVARAITAADEREQRRLPGRLSRHGPPTRPRATAPAGAAPAAAPGPADRERFLRGQATRDRQLRRLRSLREVRGAAVPPSRRPGPGRPGPGRRAAAGPYVRHQLHEAVDLEGEAGECVFAAYTGRVVEAARDATGVRGNLTIDHPRPRPAWSRATSTWTATASASSRANR